MDHPGRETIAAAVDLLAERGWSGQAMFQDESERLSLKGALNVAAGWTADRSARTAGDPMRAMLGLVSAVDAVYRQVYYAHPEMFDDSDRGRLLHDWNNADGRTVDDVVDLLERADRFLRERAAEPRRADRRQSTTDSRTP